MIDIAKGNFINVCTTFMQINDKSRTSGNCLINKNKAPKKNKGIPMSAYPFGFLSKKRRRESL